MIDKTRLVADLLRMSRECEKLTEELRNDQFNSGSRGELKGKQNAYLHVADMLEKGTHEVQKVETHFERIAERLSAGSSEQAVQIIEGLSILAARSVLDQAVEEIKAADTQKQLAIDVKSLVKSVLLRD